MRMSRNLSDRRREFDSMVHGLRVVFFVLFALPLVIGAFILMAAVLNPGQGSVATVLVPNSYWKSLLSIAARISLIPGVALLTHRVLSSSAKRRSRDHWELNWSSTKSSAIDGPEYPHLMVAPSIWLPI